MPLVSVLLAVRDGERYLGAAVESVLSQTLRDLELIVVDDGSTDGTARILDQVADPRLVVVRHHRSLGLAASLNAALERAGGRYAARLDADDLALPDRLQRQVAYREGRPSLAVVGTAVAELLAEGRVGRIHRMPAGTPAVRWHALFSSPFFHPTVLVDRDALDREGLRYDPSFPESEDYDLWTRLLERGEGDNLPSPLVLYRRHPGQASQRRRDLQRRCQRQVALRTIAALAPELDGRAAELAWMVGSGAAVPVEASEEAAEAFLALLRAFRRRYGHRDAQAVAGQVARALARLGWAVRRPRLVARAAAVDPGLAAGAVARWAARAEDRRRWSRPLRQTARRLEGRPMRVVFVSPEPTPYRAPLLDRVARCRELDLTVVYAGRTVVGRRWGDIPLRHRAVFLEGVSVPGARRLLRHDYPLTVGLGRVLRRHDPDVVVISGWSTFAAQAAVAWCLARAIPYVLLVVGHDVGPKAGWRRAVKASVVPPLVRGAASWLAVGSLARESVVRLGADPARVRILANTVDVDAYLARYDRLVCRREELRARLGLAEEDVACLCVARLSEEKGIDTLLAAAAEAGVRPVLVGSGRERRRLEDLDRRLGTGAIFAGDRPWQQVVEAYAAADVFALLSLHEPWGVVVNEAAVCALPLVLSDRVGAAYDLLRSGENGRMVPAGDVEAAAAALRELAADPALRRRWGARSRQMVSAWRYERSVESFLAACREALDGEALGAM